MNFASSLVSSHGPVHDQMARLFTSAHDNATRLAKDVEGLDHVHWARVDYMTEVELCTSWLLSKYASTSLSPVLNSHVVFPQTAIPALR